MYRCLCFSARMIAYPFLFWSCPDLRQTWNGLSCFGSSHMPLPSRSFWQSSGCNCHWFFSRGCISWWECGSAFETQRRAIAMYTWLWPLVSFLKRELAVHSSWAAYIICVSSFSCHALASCCYTCALTCACVQDCCKAHVHATCKVEHEQWTRQLDQQWLATCKPSLTHAGSWKSRRSVRMTLWFKSWSCSIQICVMLKFPAGLISCINLQIPWCLKNWSAWQIYVAYICWMRPSRKKGEETSSSSDAQQLPTGP